MIIRGNGTGSLPSLGEQNRLKQNYKTMPMPVNTRQAMAQKPDFNQVISFVGQKIKEAIEKPLTLLYMADTHKNLELLPNLKTAIDSNKDSKGESLVIHAGDYGMGSSGLSTQVDILNKLGVNFATTGNHEYFSGIDKLAAALQNSEFKTIVSNLQVPKTNPLSNLFDNGKIVKSVIKEIDGKKYAFVGAVTQNINSESYRNLMQGAKATTALTAIKSEVKNLEDQGIDRIILISHLGYPIDKHLAETVPGLDVIIGGHSHAAVPGIKEGVNLIKSPRNKEPVLILHAGAYAEALGVSHLVFNNQGILDIKPSIEESRYIVQRWIDKIAKKLHKNQKTEITTDNKLVEVANYEPDKEVNKIIAKEQASHTLISTLKKPVNADWPAEYPAELHSIVADATREMTGAQAVLVQAGCVRKGLNKGPVYAEQIKDYVLPYNSKLVKLNIKGLEILKALNTGAASAGSIFKPGLLQVSGLKYQVDMSRHKNARVVPEQVWIQGNNGYERLDLQKNYDIACDEFVLGGGDGFESLATGTITHKYEDATYADALIKYLKNRQENNLPIPHHFSDRIVITNYSSKEGLFDKLLYLLRIKIKSRIDKFVVKG